jgi:isoquinoline 1-oxidoreductase beta subunit
MHKKASISRRSFLVRTAAVGAGLAIGAYVNRLSGESLVAMPLDQSEGIDLEWDPQAFVRVDSDSRVTVISKHTEMGQGIYTGLATIVAEELDAAWEQMHVESAPADAETYLHLGWGEQATGGSSSIENSFEQLRQVGAATRAVLLQAAAQKWSVPVNELTISNGVIQHEVTGNAAQFGDLVELAAAVPVPATVQPKPIDQYRFANENLRRVDIEDKTTGAAEFTQDFSLPGMKIAVVAHAPRFGGVVASFDDAEAKAVTGVSQVVEIPTGVAVIADSFWAAQKARDLLSIKWDESNALKKSSDEILDDFKELAKSAGTVAREDGSIADGVAASSNAISAEFEYPMLAHATIEPLSYVVQWSADRCRIWAGTQMQTIDQNNAAEILGIPAENVEIQTLLAGGGYGRRGCEDYTREAMQVAKALGPTGTAVKLMWTREDDMQAGMYRPLNYHRLQVDTDSNGKIVAWQHRLVGQSIASQAMPAWVYNGIDSMSVQGAHDWLYDIPNVRVESHSPELPIPVLWYRGVGATHTVFSVETIIDEAASRAGREPLAYRLSMLGNQPRMAAVARLAAEKAGWGEPLAAGRGRGIAICWQRRSYLAQVAEVTAHDDGSFSVDRRGTCTAGGRHGLWLVFCPGRRYYPARWVRRTVQLRRISAASYQPDAGSRSAHHALDRSTDRHRRTRNHGHRCRSRQRAARSDR